MMRGYDSNGYHRQVEDEYEDEYYDQDGYEDDALGDDDQEEEEEEPEPPKPTKEEQDFLSLRERLKEQVRQKMKKQGTGTAGRLSSSQDNRRPAVVKDKFGSFFGPSQPVIASRVIEESLSIRETQNMMSKVSRPSGKSDPSSSKIKANEHQRPKVVNEAKKKAQTLKDNRDYSFLLSDDADIPTSTKEQPAAKSTMSPKPDGRFVQAPGKSKVSTSQSTRLSSNGNGLKNSLSINRHVQNKVGSMKEASANKERPGSLDHRRMLNGVRNGSHQPVTNSTSNYRLPNKNVVTNKPPTKVVNDPALKKNSVALKHHSSSQIHPLEQRRPHSSLQSHHTEQRKLHSSSQGHHSEQRRLHSSLQNNHSEQRRPHSSQINHSEQQRLVQVPERVKAVSKQLGPSSKPQSSRQISSKAIGDVHAKKKPMAKRRFDDEDEDEDADAAIGMIRKMFRYDPSKYSGRDEDDSDMEVGFDVIQREELRSSKIAREEDEEQLRLIEEEERREMMRKKRKMLR